MWRTSLALSKVRPRSQPHMQWAVGPEAPERNTTGLPPSSRHRSPAHRAFRLGNGPSPLPSTCHAEIETTALSWDSTRLRRVCTRLQRVRDLLQIQGAGRSPEGPRFEVLHTAVAYSCRSRQSSQSQFGATTPPSPPTARISAQRSYAGCLTLMHGPAVPSPLPPCIAVQSGNHLPCSAPADASGPSSGNRALSGLRS